jgi:hypothetical protein
MTEEQIALARRAVACRGWRWMPGMAIEGLMLTSTHGLCGAPHGRVLDMRDDDGMQMVSASEYPYDDDGVPEYRWADLTHIPDLTDPATLGCLLALVREAHAVPFLHVSVKISREHGYQFDCHPHHRGQWVDSEAEALVAALEDAP